MAPPFPHRPVPDPRVGGRASQKARRRRKDLRECAIAVLEGQIPIDAREGLAESIASLGTAWEALVALVVRDGLKGSPRERAEAFRALRDLLPHEVELQTPVDLEPYLEADDARQKKLMALLRGEKPSEPVH